MWLVRLRHRTDFIPFSLVYAAREQQAFPAVQPCVLLAAFDFGLIAEMMFYECKVPAFKGTV